MSQASSTPPFYKRLHVLPAQLTELEQVDRSFGRIPDLASLFRDYKLLTDSEPSAVLHLGIKDMPGGRWVAHAATAFVSTEFSQALRATPAETWTFLSDHEPSPILGYEGIRDAQVKRGTGVGLTMWLVGFSWDPKTPPYDGREVREHLQDEVRRWLRGFNICELLLEVCQDYAPVVSDLGLIERWRSTDVQGPVLVGITREEADQPRKDGTRVDTFIRSLLAVPEKPVLRLSEPQKRYLLLLMKGESKDQIRRKLFPGLSTESANNTMVKMISDAISQAKEVVPDWPWSARYNQLHQVVSYFADHMSELRPTRKDRIKAIRK